VLEASIQRLNNRESSHTAAMSNTISEPAFGIVGSRQRSLSCHVRFAADALYLPLYGRYPCARHRYVLCRAEVSYVQCCTVRAEGARWSSPPCPRPSPAAPPPRPIVHDLPQNGVESFRSAWRHGEMGVVRSTTAVRTGNEHNRCATISLGDATGENVRGGLVRYAATEDYSLWAH
jgi:hypothetical protein